MTADELHGTRDEWARASDAELAGVLARMPLFARLGKRELHKLTRHAEFAGFVAGDVVLGTDTPADFFYVVLDGEAELRDGGSTRRLGAGDHFGEIALLNAAGGTAEVVATDELSVMRVPGSVFLRVVQRSPLVAVEIFRELGGRVRHPLPDAA